nr:MAG: hypothetical protein BECKH772A_GA0070896_1000334 [Candidatus Kentron sp. H]VFJ95780.1 MAG: hypothetical protein BECKH772C_GA0070978_1000334 [Candidatus Kentron sp. H]
MAPVSPAMTRESGEIAPVSWEVVRRPRAVAKNGEVHDECGMTNGELGIDKPGPSAQRPATLLSLSPSIFFDSDRERLREGV